MLGYLPLVPDLSLTETLGPEPVTMPGCPTWPDTRSNNLGCSEAGTNSISAGGGFTWNLGALDPV